MTVMIYEFESVKFVKLSIRLDASYLLNETLSAAYITHKCAINSMVAMCAY